jgi:LacI family transcriptional regulator
MHSDRPPTIRQIAEVVGLSKSTVSAALRNHPDIAESTRLRVLAMAQELGYRTDDRMAELMSYLSQRKRKPSPTPLMWLNDEPEIDAWQKHPWYCRIYEGARERAEQLGYKIDQLWCREKNMRPQRIVQILKSRSIRGTLLIRPYAESVLRELPMDFCACAQVLCDPWDQRHHAAVADGFHNMNLVLEHLQKLGYTRPAFAEQNSIRFDTHEAYRAAFLCFQGKLKKTSRIPPLAYEWAHPEARQAVQDWLHRHRPDVLICHDNHIMEYVQGAGFRVPQDLGLVHLNLASDVEGWSGIDPHHREIGAASVDLVVNQIHHNETSAQVTPYTIMVKGSWVPGKTTRR